MGECTYPNIGFDPNFDLNYVLDFPKYCRVYPEATLCVIWSYKKNLTNSRPTSNLEKKKVWMWITPIIVLIKKWNNKSITTQMCVCGVTLSLLCRLFLRSSFVTINFSYSADLPGFQTLTETHLQLSQI